jgi:hypothetical protein
VGNVKSGFPLEAQLADLGSNGSIVQGGLEARTKLFLLEKDVIYLNHGSYGATFRYECNIRPCSIPMLGCGAWKDKSGLSDLSQEHFDTQMFPSGFCTNFVSCPSLSCMRKKNL